LKAPPVGTTLAGAEELAWVLLVTTVVAGEDTAAELVACSEEAAA